VRRNNKSTAGNVLRTEGRDLYYQLCTGSHESFTPIQTNFREEWRSVAKDKGIREGSDDGGGESVRYYLGVARGNRTTFTSSDSTNPRLIREEKLAGSRGAERG